ncbi:MAG: regulatory protein RecX [Blautia sp.]|nr:regulatory protein RecX [Blautia sp.]
MKFSDENTEEKGKSLENGIPQDFLLARKKALRLLERMDRSRQELSAKLSQAGFSEAAVEDAVRYVASYGYLDDLRFAKSYLRREQGKNGKKKLVYVLREKGVAPEVIEQAIAETAEEGECDERETVKSLIRKRCPEGETLDEAGFRRLIGYLSRRGFSFEDIYGAVDELGLREV